MQLLCGYPYFRPEPVDSSIRESGRSVHIHGCRIHRIYEGARGFQVLGDYGFRVTCTVARDVLRVEQVEQVESAQEVHYATEFLALEMAVGVVGSLEAVSYTHLTLPTNREV